MEYRRPVTLINDRKAENLADGLHDHPSVTVISRDRMKAYIDAARAGAPGATQVADRFHLVQNLAEVLDQVFSAHGSALKVVREAISAEPVTGGEGTVAVPVPPIVPTAIEEARAEQRRARRLAHYEQVWVLHRQGRSNRTLARQLGSGRMTVVRYLQAPHVSRA